MSKRIRIIGIIAIIGIVALVLKLTVFKSPFVYTGTIEATKVDVSSRVTSVISEIGVEQGDHIKKDQILLKMSCEDIALEVSLANDNYKRNLRLFHEGSQAKEGFDQSKNKYDDAALRLSWCNVASPLSGSVLTKYHQPGEMVSPGTRLFTLANLQDVYAYIYVPQPSVAALKLGQKLTGVLPEMNNRQFAGTITEIGEQAEFTPKNVQTREERERLVYAVKVQFINTDETLKPGMSIEVRLPNE